MGNWRRLETADESWSASMYVALSGILEKSMHRQRLAVRVAAL